MPSKRKQFLARPDDETAQLIPLLIAEIGKKTGLLISQSDLLRLGMRKLADEYLPEWKQKPSKPKK